MPVAPMKEQTALLRAPFGRDSHTAFVPQFTEVSQEKGSPVSAKNPHTSLFLKLAVSG